MKLSDVVAFLNHLDQDHMRPEFSAILSQVHSIFHDTTNRSLQIDNYTKELADNIDSIEKSLSDFESTMIRLKDRLKQIIKQYEPEYYAASLRLWEDDMSWETNEYILNRTNALTFDEKEALLNRIRIFADWRLPGMVLRPGKEDFIESMVPLDPLYVVDQHEELLSYSVSKFDVAYQRRLRQYVVNDRIEDQPEMLKQLPNNQFGFIFAFNYFNYKPLEIIFRYLKELHVKLRPGGRILFTYNNCDLSQGVALAERSFMCYTPGSKIREYALSLGYAVEIDQTSPANAAWFELVKAGDVSSLRGGQTLAKIMTKPDPNAAKASVVFIKHH